VRGFAFSAAFFVVFAALRPASADDVRATDDPRRVARGGRDETAASSAVGERELSRAGTTVADALRTQPGVSVLSSGSSADPSTALVRGASSAQLPVYLAGIRINDDLGGSADLSTVPAWMLRRVEIYRGNAPVDADRPGIAGAVFLDPKMPKRTTFGASTGIGSYGWHTLDLLGGVTGEGASALVAIHREDAQNDFTYADDRGAVLAGDAPRTIRRRNADAHVTDVWAIARGGRPGAEWTTVVEGFRRDQGIPGLGAAPTLYVRAATERALAGVRGRIACGDGCELVLTTSTLRSSMVIDDPRGELGLRGGEVATRGTRVEPGARIRVAPHETLILSAAGDVARESLRTERPAQLTKEATRDVARAAADASWRPTDLVLASGLVSLERTGTTQDGAADVTFTPVSARLSGRIGEERLAVLFNAGRYVRVPTLGELYGQSPAVGGNPALSPERGVTADVGLRSTQRLPDGLVVSVDAFAFTRKVDDLVAYRRATFATVRPYNVASATVRGGEIAAVVGVSRLRLDEGLTLLDARDDATSLQLPFRARLISATRLSISLGDLLGTRAADAGVTVVHQASRYVDEAGLTVLPHQTTVDVDAAVAFGLGAGALTVRGRVTNLTERARYDYVGYPLPPRQGFMTVETRLE
jgi:iron complex outermembrane receptor protein